MHQRPTAINRILHIYLHIYIYTRLWKWVGGLVGRSRIIELLHFEGILLYEESRNVMCPRPVSPGRPVYAKVLLQFRVDISNAKRLPHCTYEVASICSCPFPATREKTDPATVC